MTALTEVSVTCISITVTVIVNGLDLFPLMVISINVTINLNNTAIYLITSVGHGADPSFLAVSPQVLGCCYFPPGTRLLSQPRRSPPLAETILLGDKLA